MSIKVLVEKVAPTIATVLETSLGPSAIKILSKTLTGSEYSTNVEIKNALLNANQEMLTFLLKMDTEYKEQMNKVEVNLQELVSIEQANTKSRTLSNFDVIAKNTLATLITIAFFTILIIMISSKNLFKEPVLDLLLGSLTASWGHIILYYFSKSKKIKNLNSVNIKSLLNSNNFSSGKNRTKKGMLEVTH